MISSGFAGSNHDNHQSAWSSPEFSSYGVAASLVHARDRNYKSPLVKYLGTREVDGLERMIGDFFDSGGGDGERDGRGVGMSIPGGIGGVFTSEEDGEGLGWEGEDEERARGYERHRNSKSRRWVVVICSCLLRACRHQIGTRINRICLSCEDLFLLNLATYFDCVFCFHCFFFVLAF